MNIRCILWAETNIQKEMLPDTFDPATGRSYGAVVQGWRSNHLGAGGSFLFCMIDYCLRTAKLCNMVCWVRQERWGGARLRCSLAWVACVVCWGRWFPRAYWRSLTDRRPRRAVTNAIGAIWWMRTWSWRERRRAWRRSCSRDCWSRWLARRARLWGNLKSPSVRWAPRRLLSTALFFSDLLVKINFHILINISYE